MARCAWPWGGGWVCWWFVGGVLWSFAKLSSFAKLKRPPLGGKVGMALGGGWGSGCSTCALGSWVRVVGGRERRRMRACVRARDIKQGPQRKWPFLWQHPLPTPPQAPTCLFPAASKSPLPCLQQPCTLLRCHAELTLHCPPIPLHAAAVPAWLPAAAVPLLRVAMLTLPASLPGPIPLPPAAVPGRRGALLVNAGHLPARLPVQPALWAGHEHLQPRCAGVVVVVAPFVYPIAVSVSDNPTPGASLTPHKAVLALTSRPPPHGQARPSWTPPPPASPPARPPTPLQRSSPTPSGPGRGWATRLTAARSPA